jgi:hypothetical protein
VPAPDDYGDGEIGGIIGKGNRSTRRKPASVLLCPSQTPHAARTRTRAAAVGSQQLTASHTGRPDHRLRVFENKLLSNVFGCEGEELIGVKGKGKVVPVLI